VGLGRVAIGFALVELDEVVVAVVLVGDGLVGLAGLLPGQVGIAVLSDETIGGIVLVLGDLAFAVGLLDQVAVGVVLIGGLAAVGPDLFGLLVVLVVAEKLNQSSLTPLILKDLPLFPLSPLQEKPPTEKQ